MSDERPMVAEHEWQEGGWEHRVTGEGCYMRLRGHWGWKNPAYSGPASREILRLVAERDALREAIAAGVEASGCACPEDGPNDFEFWPEDLWENVPGESEQHLRVCPVALAARIRSGEIG
jgi:hypothetical protein